MTHTPGPWHWHPTSAEPFSLMGANGQDVIRAVDGHVYSEHSSDAATIDIHTEADANLIAAAPDMLAALKLIADWDKAPITHEHRGPLLDIIRCICDRARAEIAKAEATG